MSAHTSRFPWNLLVGFVLSIALTLLAVFVTFYTDFSSSVILWIIGAFAIFQAIIQLFMFMHVTEGKEGIINVINIVNSMILALIIIFGTIWVLTSGHAAM
ncbi:AA3-600 quinol oxidase subunit IV [Gracilibacillus boraciitolerans JCM 21714]|uniref:Quinol oxidase subunit 4 n=1 Tax=Gracilibacillus boraciitolerans JCM 21714 TaxID=1298598 RepID=W4VNB5_9BACI|nr:cytochrome aa3 quinol oxidase subunit IV [Gracilibacillus boraciitolerans]GAE94631.1 AA3-600 quinol oxidase subunit IV [Gracilibacillus boraciitolerans JCM 21714]